MSLHASRAGRFAAPGELWLLLVLGACSACTAIVEGDPANRPGLGLAGASGTGPSGSGGGAPSDPTAGATACNAAGPQPGRAPLRRMTRFEYNNTIQDLLGDTTQPANSLPSEEIGNGFSNDADSQSVSSLLAAQYGSVAQGIATRATASEKLAKLLPCSRNLSADGESACARTFLEGFAARAYRRAVPAAEVDELVALYDAGRKSTSFASGVALAIEAVLQAPDFLYKLEWGVPDAQNPALRRPSSSEMATRLSYLFWAAPPDDALRAAAAAGELATAQGVLTQATRLLDSDRSRATVRFFFDNLLPINALSDLTRDKSLFPAFSPSLGVLMREETQRFLEYEIFSANGSWASALTAPYTFVNEPLAKFYGISGVQGDAFQKVNVDTKQRLGVLLQAGVMAGTVTTDKSNPVLRGSFILNKLLCQHLHPPTDPAILAQLKVPEETSGATARERFVKHSASPACRACHQAMDPLGFALENFDPVGQYRTQEKGVTIDASVSVPGLDGTVNGPVELVRKLAADEEVHACFATQWLDFAYGRTLGADEKCVEQSVTAAFKKSGYNVKQLLLQLTQSDAFLYLPVSQ